jgi:DNA-binding NarL/FixJ family response regulator
VLLGQYAEPAYLLALLESRAGRAYLLKERLCEQGELINAVTTVARGGIVLDAEVVRSLIQARELAATSPLPRLDRDERELLELIVRGKCDEAIAQDHAISELTVTRRARAICEKLGLPEPEDARRRAQHALAYLAGDGG